MRQFINLVENADQGPQTLIDVANHFLMMHDDLVDADEYMNGDFNDMSDQAALEIIRREYVSGTCGAFAVALHDKTGYPIVGMNGGMHIAVQAPDGEIVDFLGKNPLQAVLKRYGMARTTQPDPWSREEAVEHLMMWENAHEDPWNEIDVAKWVMNKLGKW